MTSRPVVEIPGYHFDPVRNRYFRIQSTSQAAAADASSSTDTDNTSKYTLLGIKREQDRHILRTKDLLVLQLPEKSPFKRKEDDFLLTNAGFFSPNKVQEQFHKQQQHSALMEWQCVGRRLAWEGQGDLTARSHTREPRFEGPQVLYHAGEDTLFSFRHGQLILRSHVSTLKDDPEHKTKLPLVRRPHKCAEVPNYTQSYFEFPAETCIQRISLAPREQLQVFVLAEDGHSHEWVHVVDVGIAADDGEPCKLAKVASFRIQQPVLNTAAHVSSSHYLYADPEAMVKVALGNGDGATRVPRPPGAREIVKAAFGGAVTDECLAAARNGEVFGVDWRCSAMSPVFRAAGKGAVTNLEVVLKDGTSHSCPEYDPFMFLVTTTDNYFVLVDRRHTKRPVVQFENYHSDPRLDLLGWSNALVPLSGAHVLVRDSLKQTVKLYDVEKPQPFRELGDGVEKVVRLGAGAGCDELGIFQRGGFEYWGY